MRTIDIFVSSPADVQKERSVVERLIRSVATEFNLPVSVSYSNPLCESKEENQIAVDREDVRDGTTLLLCPCFWEYPELEGDDFQEQIPNTGQFDLVLCILRSRLGTALVQRCVMPDGSRPRSATDYEIAWVLDQSKRVPGLAELRLYRNRSKPGIPIEPNKRSGMFSDQRDAVQEFFATWQNEGGQDFLEACRDYQDLQEFETLVRDDLRSFLETRLDREVLNATRVQDLQRPNPFRGLHIFDFEHASTFHGRTKVVGEMLDALEKQSRAKKPFLLVMGDSCSGKSSLVRAGVLPILTQPGLTEKTGFWRRAVTRPGAGTGDPFDTLAIALLDEFGLPELRNPEYPNGWRNLAFELREIPEFAARWIGETLDQISMEEFDRLRQAQERELPVNGNGNGTETARCRQLQRMKPKAQLVLVVDQLEELFTGGFSSELQYRYMALLGTLVQSGQVFVIVTMRSEFYSYYQKFTELVELAGSGGRFDIKPPTRRELKDMVRLPADAARLRFEGDPDTGRNLDDVIVDAAATSSWQLPSLEYLLSQLYKKQSERKDGMLRFDDYLDLGEFEFALPNSAETVFATLNSGEQAAFELVMPRLMAPGRGEEALTRIVRYNDIVASPDYDKRQASGAKGLVDRLIKEGFLNAEVTHKHEVNVSLINEAIIQKWPRVWAWFSANRDSIGMRDRLDINLKLWVGRGRSTDELLRPGIGLAEAEILVRDFRSSLGSLQLDYIKKSLKRQQGSPSMRKAIGIGIIAGVAVLAAGESMQWFGADGQRKRAKEYAQKTDKNFDLGASKSISAIQAQLNNEQENSQKAQADAGLVAAQRRELEAQLTGEQEKARRARANADLAASQVNSLEADLEREEEKTQQAEMYADVAATELTALDAQLKKEQKDGQLAQANIGVTGVKRAGLALQLKVQEAAAHLSQKNADAATTESRALETQLEKQQESGRLALSDADAAAVRASALEAQLKNEKEKAQQIQANADLAANRVGALEAQLKNEQEKEKQAQTNVDAAATQRSNLEAQLKDEGDKALQAQATADLAAKQLTALGAQLKDQQTKRQQAQTNADVAGNQSKALEVQLKTEQEKAQQAQLTADLAAKQLSALGAQLKDQQEKGQQAQTNADIAANQGKTLEAQLKTEQEKAQQAQTNADIAANQSKTLEAQLKTEQEKAQQAQLNADLAAKQLSALGAQLKDQQEKGQQAQTNAHIAANQNKTLEAQLKTEQEKAQQAQLNADLAAKQLSALGAQLQDQQEKGQQAQTSADVAANQSKTLEAQLKTEQEKAQQARANEDLAAKQLSAFGAQLKSEQEKEQQAQTTADVAATQRSTLEAQLKDERAKAQQAEINADLAAKQLSALEAQLRSEQEKGQQVQAIADTAATQNKTLEAQLREAEEKAQQAQANADIAAKQLVALSAQLKNEQEKGRQPQTISDAAAARSNSLETELKSEKKKAQQIEANADLAAKQLSTLGAQLKNEQEMGQQAQTTANAVVTENKIFEAQLETEREKAQQAQTNADRAAGRLGELEAQLRQEQDNAQQAQANADFATSELRGMRLGQRSVERAAVPFRAPIIQPTVNDRTQEPGIGADAAFVWFLTRVEPEEKQDGLQWGKYARLNPPHGFSPLPPPSNTESETSNPPESQIDRRAEASGEEEFVKEFVLGYLRTVASNDTSTQQRFFAEQVNFYGRGVLNSSNIEASTQHYHEEWPIREWAPRGDAKVVRSSNPNLFVVYQPFNWTVSDGSRNAHGNATLYLRIRKNAQGEFRIINVRQLGR